MEDVIRHFGHLTLGTRLKRLGEQLQQQTQEIIDSFGVELAVAHFPVLAALDRLGSTTVGGLSQALGLAQPGITRSLSRLEADGWVETEIADDDRRVRRVRLSVAGTSLIATAKREIWPLIDGAVAEAAASDETSLLGQLHSLEAQLARTRLFDRAERTRP
ncbi:DNA-binding MarR family transcriptional regulator [Sphingomonas zeicaulis]|uniref:MarR family winged helix-turn-helix transcriptional regulator n=1 Tax=Sphingomonas zeicaulis TaxID=1632740 RepID=UPI003D1E411C